MFWQQSAVFFSVAFYVCLIVRESIVRKHLSNKGLQECFVVIFVTSVENASPTKCIQSCI